MEVESGVSQLKKNFRIYTTLLEIIEERGYYIPDTRRFSSEQEFQIGIMEVERLVFYLDTDEEERKSLGLHCNFSGSKIDEPLINRFLEMFKPNKPQTLIMVAPSSSDTDKQVQHRFYEQQSVRIQIFKADDLLFNVLKHDLVPKHIILNDKQKEQILSYYKVKQSQLPKILVSDPVARFLGLRKGQVVKIIRKSQTAGLYTTYRVAV